MADNSLCVERSRTGPGSGVSVVVHRLVAQSGDREGVADRAHPGSDAVAIHLEDCGCGIRVGTVGVVVVRREGGRGYHRRIHVRGLAGHEGPFIAELAVGGLVERIRSRATAPVVHAHGHHRGYISAGVGRVHGEGRVGQTVVDSKLVGPDAGDFVSSPILDRYRQVGRRELLPERRREGVEFCREIVRDDAAKFAGDVDGAEDVELRQHRHLVFQGHFFAIAESPSSSSKGRVLSRSWEEAHEVGNDAFRAHAFPESLDASCVALMAGAGTLIRRRNQGIVGVVGGRDGGLVGNDENVAEAGEL